MHPCEQQQQALYVKDCVEKLSRCLNVSNIDGGACALDVKDMPAGAH